MMYSDLFLGMGRYSIFDAFKEHIRTATDNLALICANHFKVDYVFIATEQPHAIEIFGRYGHDLTNISLSNGIRNRLGRRDPFIFIPQLSAEPRLRNHELFHSLGCQHGSLISMAAEPKFGTGRTGIGCLTVTPIAEPNKADKGFLLNLANSASAYIDSFLSAQMLDQQRLATWRNIDSLSEIISTVPIGMAIFDQEGNVIHRNMYWQGLSETIAYSVPEAVSVHETHQLYIPELVQYLSQPEITPIHGGLQSLETRSETKTLIQDVFSSSSTDRPIDIFTSYYDALGNVCDVSIHLAGYPIEDDHGAVKYVGAVAFINTGSNQIIEYRGEANTESNSVIHKDECDFLVNFLAQSLRPVRRSYWRDNAEYSVCRTWRAPLKAVQIQAMATLKSSPGAQIVDLAAREIAMLALHKYGASVASVVPVPCGHSPDDRCLSKALGRAVARILEVPFVDAFAHSGLLESSGPHKAAKVPSDPPRQVDEVPSPALVVDDIATTGTHITRYSQALRHQGVTAYSIAWIGYNETAAKE